MRVLVACEFSGVVRDAFFAKGHDAWSCDLLPTKKPGPHIQKDVLEVLDQGWDLMIAHPPCTYLCISNAHNWYRKRKEQLEALKFIANLMNAPIDRICIENPVGIINSRIRKPDQIIQPWMFGHPESKKTCLWLFDLPLLQPTNILPEDNRSSNLITGKGQNKLGQSKARWKLRSITYQGIANAMADQWGK